MALLADQTTKTGQHYLSTLRIIYLLMNGIMYRFKTINVSVILGSVVAEVFPVPDPLEHTNDSEADARVFPF